MSVRVLVSIDDLPRASARLRADDVVVWGDWRMVRTADGKAVWLEHRGDLWRICRGRGCAQGVRDAIDSRESGRLSFGVSNEQDPSHHRIAG
jgi:hypothetical protein